MPGVTTVKDCVLFSTQGGRWLTTSTSWDIFNPKYTLMVSLEFNTGRTHFWYPWNKCLRRASSCWAMELSPSVAVRVTGEPEFREQWISWFSILHPEPSSVSHPLTQQRHWVRYSRPHSLPAPYFPVPHWKNQNLCFFRDFSSLCTHMGPRSVTWSFSPYPLPL